MVEVVVTHLSGARRNAVETFGSLPVKLGRAEDNHVRFDPDQDIQVSAHHAELRSDGAGGIELVDLSKNGVLVNGAKVDGKTTVPNHAVVELGADGPRLKLKYDTGSGGISFSKLKQAAAAAEAAGSPKHLRTTAEAPAYTESDLKDATPAPPAGGAAANAGLAVVAIVALLIVIGVAVFFFLR